MILNKIKANFKIIISYLAYNISWLTIRPLILLVFKPKFYNSEIFKKVSPPVIFASTHKSFLDPWIISSVFPFMSRFFPVIWLADEKYFKMPIIGGIIKIYGALKVIKGKDLEECLKEPLYYLIEQKTNIGIFPEGKIVFDENKIELFKRGVGYLMVHSKAPIIPIALRLEKRFQYSDLFTMKNKAYVIFGRPFYENDTDYINIANNLKSIVSDLFFIKDYYIEKPPQEIKFECPSLLNKITHFILLPFLNSKIFSFLLRTISKEGKLVSQKPASALSMEIIYNMPKKSLFFVKSLKELNSIIFDRLLYQTKALRNRLRIVTYLIKESLLNQLDKNDNIFILSLGGGSLRSIISAISELRRPDLIGKITIWNVDNDESVISLIEEVKREFHLNNLRIKILNLNIKEFFKDFEKYVDNAFDIVELIGFLDYLPEEEVINCLNNIYSLLKNNGILICSNIAPNNETRFLENLGWPPMYYRNIVDWVYILNKTYFKKATKIIKEPLSFHNIVYIQKIHNEIY